MYEGHHKKMGFKNREHVSPYGRGGLTELECPTSGWGKGGGSYTPSKQKSSLSLGTRPMSICQCK